MPDRLTCYRELCSNGFDCAVALVQGATRDIGPDDAMRVIRDIASDSAAYEAENQEHNLAHVIGRTLAEEYGFGGDVFLRCPDEYEYGCVHGFFEYVLGESDTSAAAASVICNDITAEPLEVNKFYCYHGIGHGVMMAVANHPGRSLAICDELSRGGEDVTGCHQGVFHENIKAYLSDQDKTGAFRRSDPLYPCNAVPERHKWGCYINHAPYLLVRFDHDFERAAWECLRAGRDWVPVCLQRFGQMTVDLRWQHRMNGVSSDDGGDHLAVARSLCDDVPRGYAKVCHHGAVVQLMNTDADAVAFCTALDADMQRRCFSVIGTYAERHAWSADRRTRLCASAPPPHRDVCMSANVGVEDLVRRGSVFDRFAAFLRTLNASIMSVPYALTDNVYASVDRNSPLQVTSTGATVTIRFDGKRFDPTDITIDSGQAVTWVNESGQPFWPASDAHPTHEELPEFDALKPLEPGAEYTFVFDESGDWSFHDHMYPVAIGSVRVR